MYSKQQFLKCFDQSDGKAFLEVINQNEKQEGAIDLELVVPALTIKEMERCWIKLAGLVTESLANENAEMERNEQLIEGVARFASIVINAEVIFADRLPAGLLGFAKFFNNIVTVFTDNPSLMNSIIELCELWWKKDYPNKRKNCGQAFCYMLQMSLKEGGKKTEVKRVWSMQSLLSGVFLDEANNYSATRLKFLLLKASKSSLYLKTDEGIKFIGFLFTLSNEFVESLHADIKAELVSGTVYDARRYGKAYLEAFAAIPKGKRQFFEEECLQDLMYLGVHAKSEVDFRFTTNLHILLHVIHAQKKTNVDVSAMVYDLYQPFLWKCLTVPNCVVRSNAATILLDLFPFENPSVDIVENDSIFNKQLNLIEDILTDPRAVVRQKGVTGVCKILHLYWDVIPTRSIQKYIEILTTQSLVDATSYQVRYAAVAGFQKLVDQKSALPTLKLILPKVACAFNDVSVKVRSAMADLLLSIKYIRSIKYWEFVSVEDIVARLAEDNNSVSTKLAKLLFPTYHPQNEPDEVVLDRVITLLKLNPEASKRMYTLSTDFLDLNKGVKFILNIIKAVKLQYKRHSKRVPPDNEDSTQKNTKRLLSQDASLYESDKDSGKEEQKGDGDGSSCSELNTEVMTGLLDIAAILFRLYQKSLREERCSGHLKLLNRTCKVLPKMMSFYKNYPELCTSIISVASFLPSSGMFMIVGYCKSRLRNATRQSEYEILLSSLINWKRGDDILELVTEWLEAAMKDARQKKSRRSSRVRKGVRFCIPTNPRPNTAIVYMDYCLSLSYCKTVLLEKNRNDLLALLNNMEPIPDLIERRLMSHAPLGDLCTDIFLQEFFRLYLNLTTILHKKDEFDGVERISNIIDSLERPFLKVVSNTDVEYNEQDVQMAMNLMNILLHSSSQVVLVGFSNANFNQKIISLAQKALRSNQGTAFILEAASTLFQVADYAYVSEKHIALELLSGALVHLFEDVMKCMAAVKEITEIETLLGQYLQETMAIYSKINNDTVLSDICHTLMTTAVGCQVKSGLDEVCEKTRCLMLAAAFCVEPLRTCVEHLHVWAESDAFENKEEILAVLYIISVVPKRKGGCLTPVLTATLECKNRLSKQDNQEAIDTKILDLLNFLQKDLGIRLPCD